MLVFIVSVFTASARQKIDEDLSKLDTQLKLLSGEAVTSAEEETKSASNTRRMSRDSSEDGEKVYIPQRTMVRNCLISDLIDYGSVYVMWQFRFTQHRIHSQQKNFNMIMQIVRI